MIPTEHHSPPCPATATPHSKARYLNLFCFSFLSYCFPTDHCQHLLPAFHSDQPPQAICSHKASHSSLSTTRRNQTVRRGASKALIQGTASCSGCAHGNTLLKNQGLAISTVTGMGKIYCFSCSVLTSLHCFLTSPSAPFGISAPFHSSVDPFPCGGHTQQLTQAHRQQSGQVLHTALPTHLAEAPGKRRQTPFQWPIPFRKLLQTTYTSSAYTLTTANKELVKRKKHIYIYPQ